MRLSLGALLCLIFTIPFAALIRRLPGYMTIVSFYCLGILFLYIYFCTKMRKSASCYVAIWSIITGQFLMNVWHVFYNFIDYGPFEKNVHVCIGMLIYYALCMVAVGFSLAKHMPKDGKYYIGPRQMTSAVVFFVAFELIEQMLRMTTVQMSGALFYLVLIFVQFYCITLLYFQTELFKKSALEKELFTMNVLMNQQKEQYELTRENIDLINQKCHDLKHQVRAIRQVADEDSKEQYLHELEQSVEIYGAIVKTGNDVLDTILTEKSLACQAKGIKINCIADGKQLGFIDPVDLYAVLGNAVDNAMEAVEKLSNESLRLIDIAIFVRDQFLVINIINPIEKKIEIKNGLPVSDKPHNGYHGYGLRSMKHNLAKYDGTLSVEATDNTFILKMLLPLSAT